MADVPIPIQSGELRNSDSPVEVKAGDDFHVTLITTRPIVSGETLYLIRQVDPGMYFSGPRRVNYKNGVFNFANMMFLYNHETEGEIMCLEFTLFVKKAHEVPEEIVEVNLSIRVV